MTAEALLTILAMAAVTYGIRASGLLLAERLPTTGFIALWLKHIPGAVLIPKGEFLNGSAFSELPSDKQLVLHCKTGVRSAEVLAVLKGAGFADAVHVGGGVSAWVNQIDPSQPTY